MCAVLEMNTHGNGDDSLKTQVRPQIEEILVRRFFQGDAEAYSIFMEILEAAKSWPEAEELIENEARLRNVHPTTMPAIKLKHLVQQRLGARTR